MPASRDLISNEVDKGSSFWIRNTEKREQEENKEEEKEEEEKVEEMEGEEEMKENEEEVMKEEEGWVWGKNNEFRFDMLSWYSWDDI